MKNGSTRKPWQLSPAKLAEMAKDFDREGIADTCRPMTAAERKLWMRAKQKGKRGTSNSEKRTIAVKVDETVLKQSDRLAKSKRLTRDALIDRALKTVLMADGQEV